MRAIRGSTRVYALLGDPVAHTLSPAIHNAGFAALGIDAVYVALRCRADEVGALMRSLILQGGGGNVTIPHKQVAAAVLAGTGRDVPDVINTFWGEHGALCGAETDSAGILAALRELGKGVPDGDWCLIGTGGSARAAVRAAAAAGVRIAVRSRDAYRAARFLEEARAAGAGTAEDGGDCRLVINCTPLGLHEQDPFPLAPEELPPDAVVLDLVYRPGETRWVRSLRARGVRAADGREALLGQAVAAFEHWFPGAPAPAEVMRAALAQALR